MSQKSHWFWQYGYIVIVPIIILGAWLGKSDERENQNNVNPEVFVFFKQIEADCRNLGFDAETNQCTQIWLYKKDCRLVSAKCNSLSFYQLLKKLGFDAPEYYQVGFIAN